MSVCLYVLFNFPLLLLLLSINNNSVVFLLFVCLLFYFRVKIVARTDEQLSETQEKDNGRREYKCRLVRGSILWCGKKLLVWQKSNFYCRYPIRFRMVCIQSGGFALNASHWNRIGWDRSDWICAKKEIFTILNDFMTLFL